MIEFLYNKYIEANQAICTDTRNIKAGSIFFALKGENFNGNKFASEAIIKGASIAVVDEPEYNSQNTILVDDCLKTLQELAKYHRKKNKFKVIGITGTNGKTTTKELISAVLSKKYIYHSTKGNLNNHIGVPLTILSCPIKTEVLVVEMGANHIGEIEFLCNIAEPDYGLITNIGKAHLEGFGGFNGVIKAKSELYQYLVNKKKTVFYNDTDELLSSLLNNYDQVIPYGSLNSECYAGDLYFDNGVKTTLYTNKQEFTLDTKLFGDYNITNILAAVRIGIYFNVSINQIIEAINNYTPQNNRSQIIKTNKNTLILDSYNANPSSMKAALNSFKNIKSNNKVLILGSMKELGESSTTEHQKLIDLAKSLNPFLCLLVGTEFSRETGVSEQLFPDTNKLSVYLKENALEDKLILIKGSRANKLEDIVPYL